MSELPDSKLLLSNSARRGSLRRSLRALGRERARLSFGLSIAGLLIGLSAIVQSSVSVPGGLWWALVLIAGGTVLSVPWFTTGRKLEVIMRPTDGAVPRTGSIVRPQILDLVPVAAWREWWARAAWRARVGSRLAVLFGIGLVAAWLLAPLTVLVCGVGAIVAVALGWSPWTQFRGQQAFLARSSAAVLKSPRGAAIAASLLLVGLAVWQNWAARLPIATEATSVPAASAKLEVGPGVSTLQPAANNATAERSASPVDASVQSTPLATAPTMTASPWGWLTAHVDLNLLVVLGVLAIVAARHVGVGTLAGQVRERLQPLAQSPGGIALGIIAIFLALSLWQHPAAPVLPLSASARGEREILQATIEAKEGELAQLAKRLAPGDAHAAVASPQGASAESLEYSRLEKELADARYRLATVNAAGRVHGVPISEDSIDLTYWGRPSPTTDAAPARAAASASTGGSVYP